MRIILNKNAIKARKEKVIEEILYKAKAFAKRGVSRFTYEFDIDERNSFPPPHINISVEKASEGTVKCAPRGDYGSHVKYIIVDTTLEHINVR